MSSTIVLRALNRSDLAILHRWRNDQAITRHLARLEMSFAEVESWFDALERDGGKAYAIVIDDDFVGYAVLEHVDRVNRKCEAGIIIGDRRHWGQGVGTQVARRLAARAFEELGMHRVLAVASARNIASVRCFKGAGFQEEGRLREASFRDGEYFDLVLMSLLEDE